MFSQAKDLMAFSFCSGKNVCGVLSKSTLCILVGSEAGVRTLLAGTVGQAPRTFRRRPVAADRGAQWASVCFLLSGLGRRTGLLPAIWAAVHQGACLLAPWESILFLVFKTKIDVFLIRK